jgi:hypothetical protein
MFWTSMRWREVLEMAATIAVAVIWFVALRPVALGGPASYIVVHGSSMSGALAPGDLVVTLAQGAYAPGDAIVYRVPSGAGQGLLVVHRVIRAGPAGYTMQGDANSYVDPWRPSASDVVGRIVMTVPGLGRFLSSLANPFVLAAAWGVAALVLGLSFLPDPPGPKSDLPRKPNTTKRRRLAHAIIGWATTMMIGLVVAGAGATLAPAHAAGLRAHSAALTAQVHTSMPRPMWGPGLLTRPPFARPDRWVGSIVVHKKHVLAQPNAGSIGSTWSRTLAAKGA